MNQHRAFEKFMYRIGSQISLLAKARAPWVTGNLSRDIKVIRWSEREVLIGNTATAPYAKFVHQGTKAHEIKPLKKQALKTPFGVFKKIKHPGSKANPYLTDASEKYFKSAMWNNTKKSLANELGKDIARDIKVRLK